MNEKRNMSYLLIDIGNSFTKYTVYMEKSFSSLYRVKTSLFEPSVDIIDVDTLKSIKKIVMVSVADDIVTKKIVNKLSQYFECSIQQVNTTESSFGIKCGYTDYSLLGADRWVAIVAAIKHKENQRETKPVMVIDCGTVITVDIIDNTNQHLGGWMIPSAFMMYRSLLDKSEAIKRSTDKESKTIFDDSLVFGKSTQACVQMGNKFAEVGFIEQCFIQTKNTLKESPQCIVTGEGAKDILSKLTMRVDYIPNLIFEGLALFAE